MVEEDEKEARWLGERRSELEEEVRLAWEEAVTRSQAAATRSE